MRVRELIDILNDQPPDAEVELSIIAPIDEEADDITVDRYSVEGVLPWNEDEGVPAEDGAGTVVIWLVGGEEDDVDAFLDAIEPDDEDED
jgi:hypothetical protein